MRHQTSSPAKTKRGRKWLCVDERRALYMVEAVHPTDERSGEDKIVLRPIGPVANGAEPRALEEDAMAQRQLVEERQRIARDLHDGLGADLAGLQKRLEVLALTASGAAEHEYEQLAGRMAAASDELRQIVWGMRTEDSTWTEVWRRVQTCVRELTPSTLAVRFVARGTHWHAVPGRLAIHVLRISQEAVRNVVRHASASHVVITLHIDERDLQLTIADDGCGIDGPRLGHGGIHNIRARAKGLGGSAVVACNSPGTVWSVQMPRG